MTTVAAARIVALGIMLSARTFPVGMLYDVILSAGLKVALML